MVLTKHPKASRQDAGSPKTGYCFRVLLFLMVLGVLFLRKQEFKIPVPQNSTSSSEVTSAVVDGGAGKEGTTTKSTESTQERSDPTAMTKSEETKKDEANQGGIFLCGYEQSKIAQEVFPDYVRRYAGGYDNPTDTKLGFNMPKRLPHRRDILIMGMHGECQSPIRDFPGKVLFVNGEPHGGNAATTTKLAGRAHVGDDVYQIGLVGDTDHTVYTFHGAWSFLRLEEDIWPTLWDHSRKPINSGKYQGLMYMNRNCQPHREEAVNRISSIMTVYHGSACKGQAAREPNNPRFQRMPAMPPDRVWTTNRQTYSEYQFCMAMENSKTQQYLSEKILMAFLAGCIPIYYGSDEVFDIFNKDAFVFYNPQDPAPALRQLQYLLQNETAYHDMLHQQPILAHGEDTVRNYFSWSDRIGGGYLKTKLRTVMGLPP